MPWSYPWMRGRRDNANSVGDLQRMYWEELCHQWHPVLHCFIVNKSTTATLVFASRLLNKYLLCPELLCPSKFFFLFTHGCRHWIFHVGCCCYCYCCGCNCRSSSLGLLNCNLVLLLLHCDVVADTWRHILNEWTVLLLPNQVSTPPNVTAIRILIDLILKSIEYNIRGMIVGSN